MVFADCFGADLYPLARELIGLLRHSPRAIVADKMVTYRFRGSRYGVCMALLDVDPQCLGVLAGRCAALAAEVSSTSAGPPSLELPGQATAAAVELMHIGVGTAGQSLAGRFESIAAKLAAGGSAFIDHEQASAAELAALAPQVV